jgi:hypothetical protein
MVNLEIFLHEISASTAAVIPNIIRGIPSGIYGANMLKKIPLKVNIAIVVNIVWIILNALFLNAHFVCAY